MKSCDRDTSRTSLAGTELALPVEVLDAMKPRALKHGPPARAVSQGTVELHRTRGVSIPDVAGNLSQFQTALGFLFSTP
jgi:hypothetical protein